MTADLNEVIRKELGGLKEVIAVFISNDGGGVHIWTKIPRSASPKLKIVISKRERRIAGRMRNRRMLRFHLTSSELVATCVYRRRERRENR